MERKKERKKERNTGKCITIKYLVKKEKRIFKIKQKERIKQIKLGGKHNIRILSDSHEYLLSEIIFYSFSFSRLKID